MSTTTASALRATIDRLQAEYELRPDDCARLSQEIAELNTRFFFDGLSVGERLREPALEETETHACITCGERRTVRWPLGVRECPNQCDGGDE